MMEMVIPRDILSKIGEPYLRSNRPNPEKSKTGLGLRSYLLEKHF